VSHGGQIEIKCKKHQAAFGNGGRFFRKKLGLFGGLVFD
jgi:hypothetical protein